MKISKKQLRNLIIESWRDKISSAADSAAGTVIDIIDPTFFDEMEEIRAGYRAARGEKDPVDSVDEAIKALIPLSIDYKDASDALASLKRLKQQLK